VTPVPIFAGMVTDGGLLRLERPLAYSAHLARLKGKRVEVTVRRFREQRSLEQNAWVWGVAYPILAETLGYDMDEREDLHYALVRKCFGTHLDPRVGVEMPNARSSKLSTKEFSDYMEWLVRFAAKEFDCVIPLPNEVEVTS